MELIEDIWRRAKRSRKWQLGPISFHFRINRSVRVSNNALRQFNRKFWNSARLSRAAKPFAITDDKESCTTNNRLPIETALIVGVGPGFGFAAARKLAGMGFKVALVSRNAERLDALVDELNGAGGVARAYGCDATDERSVANMMSLVSSDLGTPHLLVYSIQEFCPGRAIDVEVPAFELCWRQNCLGGFIVAKEASRQMVPLGRGTIILTGSTSSLIGRGDHLNLAVGKFGLRALSQVLARELWSTGIHVAHVVIDADIREDESIEAPHPQAEPEHIADIVLMLHRQPKSAWSSELDVRPWNEKFWEHC